MDRLGWVVSEPCICLLVSASPALGLQRHATIPSILSFHVMWVVCVPCMHTCILCGVPGTQGDQKMALDQEDSRVCPASVSPSGPEHKALPPWDSAAVLLMDKLRESSSAPPSAKSEWTSRLLGLQPFPYKSLLACCWLL